jgi:hypothetical protein
MATSHKLQRERMEAVREANANKISMQEKELELKKQELQLRKEEQELAKAQQASQSNMLMMMMQKFMGAQADNK